MHLHTIIPTRAHVHDTHQFANPVDNHIDNVLADGVVTAGIVVGGVFLASDQLLWVEQLTVGARAYLVCKHMIVASLAMVAAAVAEQFTLLPEKAQ